MNTIPNGLNLEGTQPQMDIISKGHYPDVLDSECIDPEWTRSRMGTIPNGLIRKDIMPNGDHEWHDPEWTQR